MFRHQNGNNIKVSYAHYLYSISLNKLEILLKLAPVSDSFKSIQGSIFKKFWRLFRRLTPLTWLS
jgi:hypothetical protein